MMSTWCLKRVEDKNSWIKKNNLKSVQIVGLNYVIEWQYKHSQDFFVLCKLHCAKFVQKPFFNFIALWVKNRSHNLTLERDENVVKQHN